VNLELQDLHRRYLVVVAQPVWLLVPVVVTADDPHAGHRKRRVMMT